MTIPTNPERAELFLDVTDLSGTSAAPSELIWDGMFVSPKTWDALKPLLATPQARKVPHLKAMGGVEIHFSKYSPFGMVVGFQWGNKAAIDFADPVKSYYMSRQPHIVAILNLAKELNNDDTK